MNQPPSMVQNIYLADDDADDRLFFEDAINELNAETHLTISQNGVELMETLEKTVPPPPYAIFLDLNMPRKNGFECLNEIRKNKKFKDIMVVVFSTSSDKNAIETTYELGANYYICKPRSFELLKKAINTVLHLSPSQLNTQPSREQFLLKIA